MPLNHPPRMDATCTCDFTNRIKSWDRGQHCGCCMWSGWSRGPIGQRPQLPRHFLGRKLRWLRKCTPSSLGLSVGRNQASIGESLALRSFLRLPTWKRTCWESKLTTILEQSSDFCIIPFESPRRALFCLLGTVDAQQQAWKDVAYIYLTVDTFDPATGFAAWITWAIPPELCFAIRDDHSGYVREKGRDIRYNIQQYTDNLQ
jgi:hypothetical protein